MAAARSIHRLFLAPKLRFVVVGGINTMTGLSVIFLLKWFANAGDYVANLIGYSVGLIVSFVLNARWTFSFDGQLLSAFPRFILVVIAAYAANLATVFTVLSLLPDYDYWAHVFGLMPYTIVTFVGSSRFAFSRSGQK